MSLHNRSMSPAPRLLYENARLPRRQTLPAVFPKESDKFQGTLERMQDVSRGLDLLESNYAVTKKQIMERKEALQEALETQFAGLSRQLDGTYDAKKVQLQSLLRSEEARGESSSDVQTSVTAGTLYTGHNGSISDGHKQNCSRGISPEELYRLCQFNPTISESVSRDIPDFIQPFRGLLHTRVDVASLDITGKGYGRPVTDFSSNWNNLGSNDHRSELSDSFTAFDFPKQNGINSSFQSFSSGPYNNDGHDRHNYTSSAVFAPDNMPMSPYSTPNNKVFTFDARSSCGRVPQESPPSCGSSNFFDTSPPRSLANVPENGEHPSKVNELLRNPHLGNMLLSLADQFVPRVPQNPYHGMVGIPGLRRTNSNKSRNRSRRFSLPDANRLNGWAPSPSSQYSSSRTGSFVDGGASDSFNDLNDDAFLPGDGHRPGSNMNELEIMCRFGEIGIGAGQMNAPHGFCLGQGMEVIVADTNNHRIQFFSSNGNWKDQWGKPGKREGQLWYPRKVAWMPETNRVVVCDRGHERSRVQIFTRTGAYERTIPMDYVAIVAGMTVYRNQIVIVDSVNPTCLILDPVGNVVFWFSCSKNMKEPSDVVVAHNMFYICDFKGHCVCAYNGRGEFVSQIGDNPTINFPNGIDVTEDGTILVGDSHGNRFHVAAYAPDGRFLAEYECPHMKVSRCCGLVLTPQGHIVTIAKNNNFVLILERLDNALDNRGTLAEIDSQATEETHF